MKKFWSIALILALVAGPMPAGVYAQEAEDDEADEAAQAALALPAAAWPVRFDDAGTDFVVYPPQFDTWQGNRLEGRAAVAVTREGAEAPEFGVVWLSATSEPASSGDVMLRGFEVSRADFPTLEANSAGYVAAVRRQLQSKAWQVAESKLKNDLAIDDATRRTAAQPVRNDVPPILYSEQPAILVPVDGAPVLRDVPSTGLKRVVNTRALLLNDPASSRYYLFVSDHWMEAPALEGPWAAAANPPATLEQAKDVAVQENQVDLLDDDDEETGSRKPLAVYVSTSPTELLQTDGPPEYSPVENTRLLYVTNSPNRIFLDTATQEHYVLISGRWFRTRTLGPSSWQFVSATSLPGDFARIPESHPTESVRAAVAGTPQAREAAIENGVPQVATVNRSTTSLTVRYDGDPSFQPVEGTSLQRAVNAPIPVIRVGENAFYALDNGVWFVATSPFGPWAVATSVPAVVYSIPRSSPIHNVTYVRVYDATPEYVYVGYTPGYVGSYLSTDAVVVYGSGWHYRPWIGTYWYSAPVTWGFGFSYVHSWWRPWHPWHHHHWVYAPCYRPAWGPWHYRPVHRHATVVNNVTINRVKNVRRANVANIYNRWDRREVARNRHVEPPRRVAAAPDGTRGRGFVPGPDGTRRQIGEGGRRDYRGRDVVAQRRQDVTRPPGARQDRRAENGRADADQLRPNGQLPRIQGPGRGWNREEGRRAGDGRRAGAPQVAQPGGEAPRAQAPNRRSDPDGDRRADNVRRPDADRAQPRGEPPPIQRPGPRWQRDGDRERADASDGRERSSGSQAPMAVPPRRDSANRVAPPAVSQPRPDATPSYRRDWARQERQGGGGQDIARPQRREASPAERRQFSRPERSPSRPQFQSQAPRPSAPAVQARPPSVSRPQAQRAAPPPRMESRRMESRGAARPRAEGHARGDGGHRNYGGGGGRGFRPDMR